MNSKNQSSPVHDRGKPNRAKPDERRSVQTFEAQAQRRGTPRRRTEQLHNTQHGGIHDHAAKNQALETTPSTQTCKEKGSEWWLWVTPNHAQRTRGSARGRANSSSNHRKPLTNQGATLRRWCVRVRLTHSQTATPESKHSSRQQTG